MRTNPYLTVTPATVESSQTVVTFDCFVTAVALPGHISLHPVMGHLLIGLHGLDIGGDTGGRGPLDTPLVHCVLTH